MKEFVFNGKNFTDFSAYLLSSNYLEGASRNISAYEIAGRNGYLIQDNGMFQNMELWVALYIESDPVPNLQAMRNYLASISGQYCRLEMTDTPQEYRTALFTGFAPKQIGHDIATVILTFTAKPQRFLKSGERWVSFAADGTIHNPTLQEAKPIIRIYGTGSVMIGSKTITVNSAGTNYIDFDCELQDAYEGSNNRNSNISVDFTEIGLAAGNTGIDLTGVTVDIMPRWFEI